MIASQHREETSGVRIAAALDVLDPGAKRSYGDLVFRFARYGAGVAADAFSVVDYKAVFHSVCGRADRTTITAILELSSLGRGLVAAVSVRNLSRHLHSQGI